MMIFNKLQKADLDVLRRIVSAQRLSTGSSELDLHARDESFHEPHRPEVVLWPQSAQEISEILRYANERSVPVTPWAAGTSLEGNPIPMHGGIVVDLRQMNHVIEVRPDDLQVTVEPGLDFVALNKKLSAHGLFFPPDPGATATIGGMVANNAKGIRAIKYGSTGDQVLKLEVALPSGEIIQTGSYAMRSSSGYDLKSLFVGSEGTLGVFTQITLKLAGIPAEYLAAMADFPSLTGATRAVAQMIQAGLEPAALELLDALTVKLVNRFKGLQLTERPTLFIEFQGSSQAALAEEWQITQQICQDQGCTAFQSGFGRRERDRLWEGRYGVHDSIRAAYPQMAALVVDVAVPISRYSEIVRYAQRELERSSLIGPTFGHAGAGNLHVEILFNPASRVEEERAHETNEAIVFQALELGGTATGEHGVGMGKIPFMAREHGASLELMKSVKRLLDPHNIMNPGKFFAEP
jgi:D-lactate dehydrogenase (cytochrome)